MFEKGFAGGCAGGGSAGGGIATSPGEASVELEGPLVNPSVNGRSHSGKYVSTCTSWTPTPRVCFQTPGASDDRVLVRLGQPRGCGVVGFTLCVLPFLMSCDGLAGCHSYE